VAEAAGLVRVLTWNIHSGIGPDGRYDLERVVRLVQRHEPDIVALQEIDSRGRGAGPESPYMILTEALGRHVAEARTIVARDGHYGHVLISRWPFLKTDLHDLSVGQREPRVAIETMVAAPVATLHLAAVHLGLGLSERRRQAAMLADIAESSARNSIMLGDFNDWPWRGIVRRSLAQVLPGRTRHRTYPASYPLLLLDRVYCRPAPALVRSWTDPEARYVSDHLPVIADVRPVPDEVLCK
jgi:endonuclease/exonuclease/phosphatase family metal-dependent hydrolase